MNPFTEKEYSDRYYELQEVLQAFPAAQPDVLKKFDKLYANHRVVVVKAATGAGKGVVIATHAMMLENVCAGKYCGPNKVIVSEPRTANTHVATFIKQIVDAPQIVDYAYRFDSNITDNTLLAFVTDGLLLQYFYKDPELKKYKVLIIDEVHERNKNIDMLLCYAKTSFLARGDTKVILLSATINPAEYKKYFDIPPSIKDGVGVLEIAGVTFPVEHIFRKDTEDYTAAAIDIITEIFSKTGAGGKQPSADPYRGDILIFLASQNELQEACKKINVLNRKFGSKYACYELSRATSDDQKEIITDKDKYKTIPLRDNPGVMPTRKIIFSTNIAESGITIAGLGIVIDSGRRFEVRFNAEEGINMMEMEWISRAEAEQRAGRVGRTAPGICYHLYPSYKDLADQKMPEIAISDVTDIVFKLIKQFGLADAKKFMNKMITPPTEAQIKYAVTTLEDLNLLSGDKLTQLGEVIFNIPLDPQLAIALVSAKKMSVDRECCLLLAMLSIEPQLERWFNIREDTAKEKIFGKWRNAGGELHAMKTIMESYLDAKDRKKWCDGRNISFNKMRKAEQQFFKFIRIVKTLDTSAMKEGGSVDSWPKVIISLIRGYTRNIAIKDGPKYRIFRSSSSHVEIDNGRFSTKASKYLFYYSITRISGDLKFGGVANISEADMDVLAKFNKTFYGEIKKYL